MPSGIKVAKNWGGRRKGSGRPKGIKKPEVDRLTHQINLRVTVSQWAEYLSRGGAKWLRELLKGGEK